MASNELKFGLDEFLSQTAKLPEKALKLFIYHLMCLKLYHEANPTDADFEKMYLRSKPIAEEFEAKLLIVRHTEGEKKSKTEGVDLALANIKGKTGYARQWYDKIKPIYYHTDKVRFDAIFPKGLKPFTGKKDSIITAVGTLSLNIGADTNPAMIAIKAEVDAQYLLIHPKRHDQIEVKAETGAQYDQLEEIRVRAMEMEYRNTGLLMDKFPKNENKIQDSFHDMELLLSKQQTLWDVAIDATTTIELTKRTLLAPTKLKATSHFGSASVYLSSTPGGTDSLPVALLEDIEKKFTAADFGITEYGLHRHITIKNTNNHAIRIKFKIG